MTFLALDHVQLAMPRGEEDAARRFYIDALGLEEEAKPAALAGRGGCWFAGGPVRLHLGVMDEFAPARKAHPALLVDDLETLRKRLSEHGVKSTDGIPIEEYERCDIEDCFGNRIELMERIERA